MNFIAHRYYQHEQEYLSLVMPFQEIQKSSKILMYGESKYGYQRKLDKKHYMGIKKTLLTNNKILPTSIILSVNKQDITNLTTTFNDNGSLVNIQIPREKIFRVVDGQHRLKGLGEAAKEKEEFLDYQLNVIILVTEEDKRVVEIEVFRDINAEAKKLKTDLTLLAEHNYRLLGKKEIQNNKELINHMSIKVAYYLNEGDEINSYAWKNGIKFDIHVPASPGIIGVSAFTNSIHQFVRYYNQINLEIEKYNLDEEDFIKIADEHSKVIAVFINEAWKIIKNKWPNCFEEQTVNDYENLIKIFYNKGYYLQKTTGVNALHNILWRCLSDNQFDTNTLENFSNKLKQSVIREKEWSIGGIFSGLTSQSGFKKAQNIILSERNI